MRIGGGYHEVAFEYLRPPHDILEYLRPPQAVKVA